VPDLDVVVQGVQAHFKLPGVSEPPLTPDGALIDAVVDIYDRIATGVREPAAIKTAADGFFPKAPNAEGNSFLGFGG